MNEVQRKCRDRLRATEKWSDLSVPAETRIVIVLRGASRKRELLGDNAALGRRELSAGEELGLCGCFVAHMSLYVVVHAAESVWLGCGTTRSEKVWRGTTGLAATTLRHRHLGKEMTPPLWSSPPQLFPPEKKVNTRDPCLLIPPIFPHPKG